MLNGFGWPHLLILATVVIVLFGAKRLPDAARGLGRSMRIFRAETRGLHEDEIDSAPSGTAGTPPRIAPASSTSEESRPTAQQRHDEQRY